MMSNQTAWPYHLYTGSDPRKQGSYVKCKNNPCLIHGGTDIIAISPEDAYEKANENNTWGFNAELNHSIKKPLMTPVFSDAEPHQSHIGKPSHVNQLADNDANISTDPVLVTLSDEEHENNHASNTTDTIMNPMLGLTPSVMESKLDDVSTDANNTDAHDASNEQSEDETNEYNAMIAAEHENDAHYESISAVKTNDEVADDGIVSKDENNDEVVPKDIQAGEAVHSADWLAVHQYENEDERKLIDERDAYLKQHGLYVYDSPLFHRVDSKTTPYQLAAQVFPDAVKAQDIGGELWERSNDVYDGLNASMKAAFKTYTNTKFKDINRAMRGVDMINDKNTLSKIKLMKRAMTKTEGILQKDTVFYRRRFIPENDNDSYYERGKEELSFYRAVAAAMNDYQNNKDAHVNNNAGMNEAGSHDSSSSSSAYAHKTGSSDAPIVSRPNFLSTSAGGLYYDSGWHGYCSFIIKAPAGTRGMYMVDSRHGTEREFLIDGGYDYKVVGIYETGNMIKRASDDSFYFPNKPVIALEIVPRESNYQYDKTKPLDGSLV